MLVEILLNFPLVLANANFGFLKLINRLRIIPQGAVSEAHVFMGTRIAWLPFKHLFILIDGFAELALHIEDVADVLLDARPGGIKHVRELQLFQGFVRSSSGVETKSVAIVRQSTIRIELDCL